MLMVSTPVSLGAQQRAPALIRDALQHFESRRFDSARTLLLAVLDTATLAAIDERQTALIWLGIIAHAQGQDTLTRAYFQRALAFDPSLTVEGLSAIAPELEQIFVEERRAAFSVAIVHMSGSVDEPPQRISGPPVAYPAELLRHPVAGTARVSLVVDTAGRVEPKSIEVLEVPDSALIEPVKVMFLASQFRPGRHRGRAVRVMTVLRLDVRPPRLNAADLVRQARALPASSRTDSAEALLDLALGPLAQPSEAARAYALLARGVVRARAGQDTLARRDYQSGLAVFDSVVARGVELAPFVRRLADSIRRSSGPRATLAAPRAVDAVDQPPTLVSHPPIRFPAEARTLGLGGTVIVEAALDTAGRVVAGSVRVAESQNSVFNAEAIRVVQAAIYRPARKGGRPARTIIRQAVTFLNY
jgi:TonB family protein